MTVEEAGNSGLVPPEIVALRDRYRERREQSLLDAAAAVVSLNTILTADAIDFDAVTPQMREAFELAFPNDDLAERLAGLDPDNAAQLTGFMNNWRGKYFEVLVRDELNTSGQVGDMVLGEGQNAVLASDLSQPGWDLRIVNDSGLPISEIQLKATESASYVREAIERYPDIGVLTTEEVAESIADIPVLSSGISNTDLDSEIAAPLDSLVDSPLQDVVEAIGMGLPVLLIAGTEGTMWLVGRQTFDRAMSRSIDRALKSGTAMAVGGLVAMAGGGVFSLPATMLTRLAFARHGAFSGLSQQVDFDIEKVRMLAQARSAT
ncbi:MAG: hypothetical protein O3B04_02090 [Chloroflexi bacterium]|nr:hypothetical protein [Chloroflexota bacterium]MDA1296778.1 hypothetical protein [Chloroflexota bacterium]